MMKVIRAIYSNWGLKLASVLFAMVLWYLVTNISDPVTTDRFNNISVSFRNTSIVTDAGEIYEVLDGSDIISSVSITAPRSVADSFSRDNIIAIADFSKMTDDNTVPIDLSVNKYSSEVDNISGSISEVKLSIENLATATLALECTTSGSLADGYVVSNVQPDQNQVRISGPQSVIDRVARAVVDVPMTTGFTSTISSEIDIKLYDADGMIVSDSSISMNMKSVKVTVTIFATATVPLNFRATGEPAEGFMVTGRIDSTPSEVLIAGKSSVLSEIKAINITDALDVSGLTSDLQTTVNIEDYLPGGVILGDNEFNGVATVVVDIAPVSSRTISLDSGDVTYDNVPENYTVILGDGTVSSYDITIKGLEDTISSVSAADLNAVIDMSQLTENLAEGEQLESGQYTIQLLFSVPDGVTIPENVRVTITVRAPETEDTDG